MTRYTVAVDASDAAREAVQWIGEVADPRSDSVRLVTVAELFGELPSLAEARLLEARTTLREQRPGLQITTEVVGGWTVHGLVSEGAAGDVLVIGGRQRHRFVASLQGRVAERAVARALTPVVVVPESRAHHDGAVVVGVDSRSAGTALVYAATVASGRHLDLVLTRAWQAPFVRTPYGIAYYEDDLPTWERKANLEIEAALHAVEARYPALPTLGRVRRGSVEGVLLRESTAASMIVTGRRHRTALGGLLTGSIGEALMHRAHVPIAVVGPHVALPSDIHRPAPPHPGDGPGARVPSRSASSAPNRSDR
ncbi:universal stress protein [Curtobacterium pusillum]|uniref:universal stress protein n=1 Tax=Curtobacterium pusillum TaxID=69373 RepID=UPI001643EEB2|nr:universal stress protein [Curtobacterium pusillum]